MTESSLGEDLKATVENFLTVDQDAFQNMVRDPRLWEDFVEYHFWQNDDQPGTMHYNGRGKIPGEDVKTLGDIGFNPFIEAVPYRVSFSQANRGDIEGKAPQVNIDRVSNDPTRQVEEIADELGLREYKTDTYIVKDGNTGVAYLTTNSPLKGDTVRVEGTGLPSDESDEFQYSSELEEVITQI